MMLINDNERTTCIILKILLAVALAQLCVSVYAAFFR
jgi:hypothetical protein